MSALPAEELTCGSDIRPARALCPVAGPADPRDDTSAIDPDMPGTRRDTPGPQRDTPDIRSPAPRIRRDTPGARSRPAGVRRPPPAGATRQPRRCG